MRSPKRLIAPLLLAFSVAAIAAGPASAEGPGAKLKSALRDLVHSPGGPLGGIAIVQRGARRAVFRAGVANIALGLIVARIRGHPYHRALHRLVFRSLGLRATSLPRGFRMPRPFIHGYDVPDRGAPQDLSEALSSSSVWASGGMVSTPNNINRFARVYAGGALLDRATHRRQLHFVKGGHSEPPGPGVNAAGLGIFRYRTRCGTVFGHTGNFLGYTQLLAATADGRRSVTVSVNKQLSPNAGGEGLFAKLRRADVLAVCAAMQDR